jgi:AMIN domain
LLQIRPHSYVLLLATFMALAVLARSQPTVVVQSVKVVPEDGGVRIEILSSRPLTPQIQTAEKPLRLLINLPSSTLSTARKQIPFHNEQIKDIHLEQYQPNPATSRIVIDLAVPVRYTSDAVGNRLNIRIRADEAAAAKPPKVPAAAPATQPVAVPYAPGASGNLVEVGSRVSNGSSITAKDQTAVLRLTRGGEVRVCPGTTLSVATSPGGEDLMLGMNTGAMETHYHLDESSDSILTPDFRIVLPGPGEFNLAIRSEPSGDTCVSSLVGSNSSIVVAELLGNGTYEIKPEQQVLFRQGKMQSVEAPLTACGCPSPQEPVLRASSDPAPVVPEDKTESKLALANSNVSPSSPEKIESASGASSVPNVPAPAEGKAEQTNTQASTPLVFNAKEFARMRAEMPPVLSAKVASLPLSAKSADPLPPIVVLPPNPKPIRKGFFGKIGGLFRSMF